MKRKFGNLLMAATLVFAVGVFFTSCRDHDEELNAEMHSQIVDQLNEQLAGDAQGTLADAEKAIKATEQDIDALQQRIDSLAGLDHGACDCPENPVLNCENCATKDELKQAVDSLGQLVATKEILKEAVDSLAGVLRGEYATVVEQFGALSTTVNTVVAQLSTLDSTYKDLKERVEAIEKADYQKQIDEIWGKLNPVLELAAATDARSKADSIRIDVLEANDIAISKALKDSIDAVRAEAVANLQAAKDYADEAVAVVAEELEATNATVAELQEAFKGAVAELQDQIDVLAEELGNLKGDVDAVNARVDEVVKDLEEVKKYLEDQITSVVLNGAYSPVVGYFSLPNGVKSNILAAYYGKVSEDFSFPTVDFADNGITLDEKTFNELGLADNAIAIKNNDYGVFVTEGANAGKVYMTINPAEVDIETKTFSLVNSRGEESPAKILGVNKSEDVLAFGYTRDGAVALYEAHARIENAAEAKIRMNLSDFEAAIKDVVTVRNGVNITDVVTTLYTLVNDIADAHAVQAVWTDAEGVAHTVYSDYALATVAIKPFGYTFLQGDFNIGSYVDVTRFVNVLFDKAGSFTIPELGISERVGSLVTGINGQITNITNDSIEIPLNLTIPVTISLDDAVADEDKVVKIIKAGEFGSFEANGETHRFPSDDYQITVNPSELVGGVFTQNVPFKYTVKLAIGDVLPAEVADKVETIKNLLNKANDVIAALEGNKIENIATADKVMDKVQNKLNYYLDKLNNKISAKINSFNNYLQPTMLVNTVDGFSMLSSIKDVPTTIDNASAVLVPTSFTAEILAPASQKFVAVTNAWKDGKEELSAAKAANTGDFATVLPGGTRTVQFNGQAGYTYEITYQALDFEGHIANTKYYVKVK